MAAATQPPNMPSEPSLLPVAGSDLVVDSEVMFQWQAVDQATTYEFFFYSSGVGAEPTISGLRPQDICSNGSCSFTTTINLPLSNNHLWRVRAVNSQGNSSWTSTAFNVVEPSSELPESPVLLLPIANAMLETNTSVSFQWQTSERSTRYDFELINTNEPLNNLVTGFIPDSTCQNSVCELLVNIDFPLGDDYLWRVVARNGMGPSDSVESAFSVVLEDASDAPPNEPTIISPNEAAEVVVNSNVIFQWQEDVSVDHYEFFITDADTGPVNPTVTLDRMTYCASGTCSFSTVVDLPISALNSWQVRAHSNDLSSDWVSTPLIVVDMPSSEAPIAAFTIIGYADDAVGMANFSLSAVPSSASEESAIETYTWDFGDGSDLLTNTTGSTVSHTYTDAGVYNLTLTVEDDTGLTDSNSRQIRVLASPAFSPTAHEASRFLAQSTFGPNSASISELQSMGMENWLERQFTLQGPPHLDYVLSNANNASDRDSRHEIWWKDVVEGEDQLRQRVAFALSQLFVISDAGYNLSNEQYAVTNYYDMLREHAFGNYRDLLESVTLSPVMGFYLSMLQNARSNPDPLINTRADENFAREVLQLFSIGLHVLEIDGTTEGVPVFTQDHIEAFARVFTGWNYAGTDRWNKQPFTGADMLSPMEPYEEHLYHDTGQKNLLNGAVATAGLTARQDLEFALDNIFNHPNVGPFISTQLIKRLVTSNPTPNYVERVARVFNDNSEGVRGDLKAVVTAILMDEEARNPQTSLNESAALAFGKLREPHTPTKPPLACL